jgi:hypothetical protein
MCSNQTSPASERVSREIFVVGSGRSGSHWLGYILQSHQDIFATVEDPQFIQPVTRMALDPSLREELFPQLVRDYRRQHRQVLPLHYADKSHPNLWLAESLANAFPNSLYVGIQRDAFGTIASMLKHKGVLAWHHRWRDFPLPNRFLGITHEIAERYDQMSIETKCALRWQAHANRMREAQRSLDNRLMVIPYEDLIADPQRWLKQLVTHHTLDRPFPPPEVKTVSRDRWRSELTTRQIADIVAVTGRSDHPHIR